ncbi:MAG: GNAT family N-acetyltransferase [Lachnospiraceae bacterium]|nr:GNAT family N-acetyltransferase [Lachnospiraceae bacterium]
MIQIKKTDRSFFEMYDSVSMNVDVRSEFRIKRIDNGLGGLVFEEVKVKPYVKDLSVYERATEYEKEFDISHWFFYMAFDDEKPVGAMTIAAREPKLYMLSGRDDACVLWDIRVTDGYKHRGIGQKMLDMGIKEAKENGYRQMIIECQNNNVPACRFYKKQGALLSKVDMYAYYQEEACRDEVQFLWYLDL